VADNDDARRLADQRTADLALAEFERGKKEAEDRLAAQEIRREFAEINKAIAEFGAELRKQSAELASLKTELTTKDAVNAALIAAQATTGAKKLTRLQTIILVLGFVIAAGSLLVAVLQTVG